MGVTNSVVGHGGWNWIGCRLLWLRTTHAREVNAQLQEKQPVHGDDNCSLSNTMPNNNHKKRQGTTHAGEVNVQLKETKPKQQSTRPSILCVTQKRAFMPLYIVLGQQRACMPVYIGKSGDLVGWHRCLTDTQTTEYSATQLLSSIQFKLSHAICKEYRSSISPLYSTSQKKVC